MSGKLEGKVALVTGGTSGIGLATAKRFAAEGAHVFITGRRQPELDAAVKAIGGDAIGVRGDVLKLTDLDALYETIGKHHAKIDVIFANAGGGSFAPFGAVTEEQFDREFDVNVKGTFFTVQKALPLLRDGASIILNASIAGSKGPPAFTVYCATKAAIRSFARTWTTDLKDRHIRVNAVSPGPIETEGLQGLVSTPEEYSQLRTNFAAGVPMRRVGTGDEVAKAVVFLASDDSSFITGIELFVDGGVAQV